MAALAIACRYSDFLVPLSDVLGTLNSKLRATTRSLLDNAGPIHLRMRTCSSVPGGAAVEQESTPTHCARLNGAPLSRVTASTFGPLPVMYRKSLHCAWGDVEQVEVQTAFGRGQHCMGLHVGEGVRVVADPAGL